MPETMTYEKMLEEARKVFGPKAEVRYVESQWVIETGIEEEFNPLAVKDQFPHAFEASEEYEATYGSTLDRWAAKNGMWGSQREIFQAYEEMVVREFKEGLALVRKMVAEGKDFSWPGGPEYRDRMLALGEKHGL